MSWEEVTRTTKTSAASRRIPVAITLSGSKNGHDRVSITVRPSLLEAGQIRIEPSATGPFKLTCTGKQLSARIPGFSLSVRLPLGTAPLKRPNQEVEYDYSDRWLEITLPAVARKADVPKRRENPAPATAKAPAPFSTQATKGGVRPAAGGR